MDSINQGYVPLDLQSVLKSLPKSIKKPQNDRDVEAEISEICETLKDLSRLKRLFIYFCFSNRLEKKNRSVSETLITQFLVRSSMLWRAAEDQCAQLHHAVEQTFRATECLSKFKFQFSNLLQIHDLRSLSEKQAGLAI